MKANVFIDDKMTDGTCPFPADLSCDGKYLMVDLGSFAMMIPVGYVNAVMEESWDDKNIRH